MNIYLLLTVILCLCILPTKCVHPRLSARLGILDQIRINPARKILPSILGPVGDVIGVTHVVNTNAGRVRGKKRESRSGYKYYDFRGIPYAKPPLGPLRFEPPEPHPGWNRVLDATTWGPPCLHIPFGDIVVGKEDCLTLNIASRTTQPRRLLPVMVFIHGGLFMYGGSSFYPPLYFMDEEIVLVSMNYRLSSFGFLNTGDDVITGNMGLKDQLQALKWVSENIENFNGDPSRIKIFGESAGSACVHLHTLSPLSRGYFHAAISQSGTALSPWAIMDTPKEQARQFAQSLGCAHSSSKNMVKCLKRLPALKIAKADLRCVARSLEGELTLFKPTVDVYAKEKFLPRMPIDILRSGDISRTPWITGVNSGEGLIQLMDIMRNETLLNHVNQNWEEVFTSHFQLYRLDDPSAAAKKIRKYYLNDEPITQRNLKNAVDLFSHRSFVLDNHDSAILQSAVAPTYVYYYKYNGVFAFADLLFTTMNLPIIGHNLNYLLGTGLSWLDIVGTNNRRVKDLGVSHADELALQFNLPALRREIKRGDPDLEFSKKFVALWVSFAENGFPDVSKTGTRQLKWLPLHVTNPDFKDNALIRLQLDDRLALVPEPFFEDLVFWKKLGFSRIE